jgi:trk system potassium uptake protein TrkH
MTGKRLAVVATVAVVAIGADLGLAHPVTAVPALVAMVTVLWFLARELERDELLGITVAAVFAIARAYVFGLTLFEPGAAGSNSSAIRTYDGLFVAFTLAMVVRIGARRRLRVIVGRLIRRPARLLATSFAMLIAVAALLLVLPISVERVTEVSLLNAIFMAASAVCVTGLTVNDIGSTYSIFGQAVIIGAAQLGGIGIMTIAALAAVLRPRGPLRDQARYAAALETGRLGDLRKTVAGILFATFLLELFGASLLAIIWAGDSRLDGHSVWWAALFHSVSAFTNSGFSLFSDSLARFAGDSITLVVVMGLTVLGGLGFPVLIAIFAWRRRSGFAIRTVVKTSAILIVVGAVGFAVLESAGAFGRMAVGDRLVNALFASVIARTGGFSTVDIATLGSAALMVTMALMFIGGSPGSTAGGVKTTTAAVLFAALRGELRGREPRLGNRAIPPETLRRAIAVVSVGILVVFGASLLLTLTEPHSFMAVAFEAVSAFATTGLSLGITPELSIPGKMVVIATMFIGRVGPLTVALAVSDRYSTAPHRLPPAELPIG